MRARLCLATGGRIVAGRQLSEAMSFQRGFGAWQNKEDEGMKVAFFAMADFSRASSPAIRGFSEHRH